MANQPTVNQLLQQNNQLRQQNHVLNQRLQSARNLLDEFARPILQYSLLNALFRQVVAPNTDNFARACNALNTALDGMPNWINGQEEMSFYLTQLPLPLREVRVNAAHPERYLSLSGLHDRCVAMDRAVGSPPSDATRWAQAAMDLANTPQAATLMRDAWDAAPNN